MKAARKFFLLILAILLVATAASGALQAAAFYYGQWVGFGTVTGTSARTVATGVTYDNLYVSGTYGGSQRLQTLTFNPRTSDYVPLVYTKYSGYGDTTYNSAVKAESLGYDVKGGVNASFFSFTGSSCNTYGGVNISDGKVMQGSNSHGQTWVLAFDSEGGADLVWSKVTFAMSAKNGAWSAPVENVNICPETTYTGIYYYDEFCGNNTDTKSAGVEIVFEKLNGTQLTVGGTLEGRVVAVRSSTSSGGSIGAGRFVLYASNASSYASSLRGLSVGDTVEITATETVSGAKTVMENCSSAFVTYGYHIVSNGQNVTSSNGLGEAFNTARAQRSAIGIKADGTIILVAANGRTSSYAGLTVYELADYLISQGCVTAVNLDGGGSTQMTVENSSGSLGTVLSSSRRVANSILVVERPSISSADRNTLDSLLSQANALVDTYVLAGDTAYLEAAISYAEGIYSSSKSMPGDYTKAIMRLRDGMEGVAVSGYRTGIFRLDTAQPLRSAASASAGRLASIPAGRSLTVTEISGNYGYTKYLDTWGWIDLTQATGLGAAVCAGADITAPEIAYKGQDITVSWSAVNGAAAYSYTVIELEGEPDPTSINEGDNATVLASGDTTDRLSVTIPASARTDGKYLKVAVCVEFPSGNMWSCAYVRTSHLPFTDVGLDFWGYDAIRHCYENGYFSGTSGTTFSPDGTMTRSMLAVVVHRMAGSPAAGTVSLPFTDVPASAWYRDSVAWCYSEGIVAGTSGTTFSPDNSITREQAAVFLYRLANTLGYDTTVSDPDAAGAFSDASLISGYAETAIAWAVENNIMNGNNNLLNPQGTATRAQIAQMLYKFDIAFQD